MTGASPADRKAEQHGVDGIIMDWKNVVAFVHGIGEIGGAERELLAYLEHLPRMGIQPLVVCPAESHLADKIAALGITTRHVPFPAWRKLLEWPRRGKAVSRLREVIERARPSLVHVNDIWWLPQTLRAVKGLGIPVLCHVRQEIQPRKVSRYRLPSADVVFAVSRDVEASLQAGGVKPERIHILHGGIDLARVPASSDGAEFRRRLGIPPAAPLLGTVANLFPRKGHDVMCHALSALRRRPEIHYLIVGAGDPGYEQMLRKLVQSLGLEGHVHFAGFQDPVYPALAAMDLYVHPAIMEGFGIALLEAMAMAKPVVATRTGGIPDIVVPGETGMLVTPGDSEALASAIDALLDDKSRWAALGQAGRKRVERLFTVDAMISKLVACYEAVIRDRGSRKQGALT
jgi:glycosyltransferase involved in cell wall biosynthesis